MLVRSVRLPGLLMSLLLWNATAAQSATPPPSNPAKELIQADRRFSDEAGGKNVVDAIGNMLADDARAPKPDGSFAVSKQEVVASLSANPSNLTGSARWTPVRVGVSGDGRHGFTYGFMTLRNDGQPDRRAKYLAYWAKLPEGWRVVAYKRAPSAEGPVITDVRPPAVPPQMSSANHDAAQTAAFRDSLIAREKAFSDRAREAGLRQAFLEYGSADAMNIGGGADFIYGNAAIAEALPAEVPSPVVWGADEGAIVASSGDLGVTFGYIRSTDSQSKSPFFTLWRRNSPAEEWKYVAE